MLELWQRLAFGELDVGARHLALLPARKREGKLVRHRAALPQPAVGADLQLPTGGVQSEPRRPQLLIQGPDAVAATAAPLGSVTADVANRAACCSSHCGVLSGGVRADEVHWQAD